MHILNCEQGGEIWLEERRAKPTSSCFSSILTAKGAIASGWDKYLNKLLAEYIDPETSVEERVYTKEMRRGNEMEPEACACYEMISGNEVEHVGGIFLDEKHESLCSPDGIMRAILKGLELKCPKLSTHVGWIRDFEKSGEMPQQHLIQVQTGMAFSGFKTWDFMSYHPSYKPLLITVEADTKLIKTIQNTVRFFINELNREKAIIDEYKSKEF